MPASVNPDAIESALIEVKEALKTAGANDKPKLEALRQQLATALARATLQEFSAAVADLKGAAQKLAALTISVNLPSVLTLLRPYGAKTRTAAPEGAVADGEPAETVGPLPATEERDLGFRDRLVASALREWEFFKCQTYDIEGHISQVGMKEAQEGAYQRIGQYWVEGTKTRGVDGLNADMPWSAAFISYIMKVAGAGLRFRYSTLHAVYIYQGIRDHLQNVSDAGYWTYRLNEHRPQVGDLICFAREPGIDYDNQKSGSYKSHCDVVVAVSTNHIEVVGGNVGNSVTRRPIPTKNGFLAPSVINGEPLFAVMSCRIDESDFMPNISVGVNMEGEQTETPDPELAWGAVVDPPFRDAIRSMCDRLGCDPSHLMACIAFETGETFSPSVKNPKSGATGLIQFMPSTAQGLGTTTKALESMSRLNQLSFVERYFQPYKGKLNNLSDLYMAILWPAAVGKSEAAVLFKKGTIQFSQNQGLDINSDGEITKAEAAALVQRKLERGLSASYRA